MYDAREIARRDRVTAINSARDEGEIEGEIKTRIETVQGLQGLLGVPVGDEPELRQLGREQLRSLARTLQEQLRNRTPL